jgi:hypothetical protein
LPSVCYSLCLLVPLLDLLLDCPHPNLGWVLVRWWWVLFAWWWCFELVGECGLTLSAWD